METIKIKVDTKENANFLIKLFTDLNFIRSIEQNGTSVKEFDNYVTPGEPMSIETFRMRIKKAERDIKKGKMHTSGAIRQMMEKW
ncbi:MAG: hypothetical protein FVQ77_01345 [Cytophagales bacterium]|nr:hypothetical protein [Cytophagales bacterium]